MGSPSCICIVIALLPAALGQCHLGGLAKSTYAASPAGAAKGLHFLVRVFNATVARDSEAGNGAVCPAGSSPLMPAKSWTITQGRAETLANANEAGTCWISHERGAQHGSIPVNSGSVKVVPSGEIGVDCNYTVVNMSSSTSLEQGRGYVAHAHSADTCCKACSIDSDCASAVYIPGSESFPDNQSFGGECFGLHLASLPGHDDSPGDAVELIETAFTAKFTRAVSLHAWDAFLDYNVAFYVQDLDFWLSRFLALQQETGLQLLVSTWPGPDDHELERWWSAVVQVPGTQMILELMSDHSSLAAGMPSQSIVHEPLSHLSATSLSILRNRTAWNPEKQPLHMVSIGRAASDLEAVDEFYRQGFQAQLTFSKSTHGVSRRCYQLPDARGDICFVKRTAEAPPPAEGANADLQVSVKDMENMLFKNHASWLVNPNCAMDRWTDNHYCIDTSVNYDHLVDFIAARVGTSKAIYYDCGDGRRPGGSGVAGGGVHYVVDPTGWGVQVNAYMTVVLPRCNATLDTRVPPDVLPWCSAGTCTQETLAYV